MNQALAVEYLNLSPSMSFMATYKGQVLFKMVFHACSTSLTSSWLMYTKGSPWCEGRSFGCIGDRNELSSPYFYDLIGWRAGTHPSLHGKVVDHQAVKKRKWRETQMEISQYILNYCVIDFKPMIIITILT